MISGEFSTCFINQITVLRSERQRREIDDLEPLKDSIRRLGLIHPIVVTRDFSLVAGERRLSACKSLGWDSIPFQYVDELDPFILHCIELEENIKRKDLPWQDQNDAIAKYHELRALHDKSWTQEKSAQALGLSEVHVRHHILVKNERSNPLVASSETFRNARRVAQGIVERRGADELNTHIVPGTVDTQPSIICADFNEWAPTYSGPKFNLIHCDFPYGIKSNESGQGAVKALGGYTDTEEVYWQLLKTLAVHLDNFCAPSAHMIFWFSPTFYCQTWEMLKLLDGFKFDEVPLIWHKDDNKGIAPDQQRRPRRLYEMAFFGWRGDRKIIKLKNNIVAAPTIRERHPHEKSELALLHFFEMCVDNSSRIFDPTCGSGSALRAAERLGARISLGLERDTEFASIAERALADARRNRIGQQEDLSGSLEWSDEDDEGTLPLRGY